MEDDRPDDRAALAFQGALSVLIVANVAAVALETIDQVWQSWPTWLIAFEVFSVAVFGFEYAVRVWISVEDPRYAAPISGRLRYMLSLPALIDLVAIAPSLVAVQGIDLRFMRSLRLLRVLRLLKLGRYSEAMQLLTDVLREKRGELVSALVIFGVALFIAAGLLFAAERRAQPGVFSSIPQMLWIVVANFSGNGETPPVTVLGKVLAGGISILSAGLFALPAGILAFGFSERLAIRRKDEEANTGTYPGDDRTER